MVVMLLLPLARTATLSSPLLVLVIPQSLLISILLSLLALPRLLLLSPSLVALAPMPLSLSTTPTLVILLLHQPVVQPSLSWQTMATSNLLDQLQISQPSPKLAQLLKPTLSLMLLVPSVS